MICTLYDKHPGASIAIVGTGPSASGFLAEEDICIALNAAIQMPFRFSYHMMYDKNCPKFPMWTFPSEATKVIGANIAGEHPDLYDEIHMSITQMNCKHSDWLEAHPPKHPHVWFYYRRNVAPLFDRDNILTHKGTIAHPATLLAFQMGAASIRLYGIDLKSRGYVGCRNHMGLLVDGIRARGVKIAGF
jgi:hypothetical protein